jgi:hypothetical protein
MDPAKDLLKHVLHHLFVLIIVAVMEVACNVQAELCVLTDVLLQLLVPWINLSFVLMDLV